MLKMANTKVNQLLAANQPPTHIAALGGQEKILPYCNFELNDGDVLYLRVASGGGYGDPLERDAELVRGDVANAIVSRDAARDVYGVVLGSDLAIDWEGTRELRQQMRRKEIKSDR